MTVLPAPAVPTHVLGGACFTSHATPSRGSTGPSVWLVDLAPGTEGTPHQLTREEVFVVLAGRAEVRLGDTVSHAEVGDAIVVAPEARLALPPGGTPALR